LVSKRKASLRSPAENKVKRSTLKSGFDDSDDSEHELLASPQTDEEGSNSGASADSGRSESEGERDQTVPRVAQWLDEDELNTDDEDDDSSAVSSVNEQEDSRTVSPCCSLRFNGIGAHSQTFIDIASKRFV
jgi:hypothetical protein